MKRRLVLLFILLLPISFVFSSGSKESGPVTIEFWTHEDVNRAALEDRYAEEFMALHPDVKININRQASTKLIDMINKSFAAGQGPTVFNLPINDAYPYIVNGQVAEIDYEAAGYEDADAVRNAYLDGMLEPVIYNGGVYGLPLEITNWCIFINRRVFEEAGLDPDTDFPRTWEDMVTLSERLVLRDGNILIRRGFDFRYPYYLESLVPMVEQLGGALFSDDMQEAIVGENAWIQVLSYMQQWGPAGLNLGSPTYKNARSLFNQDNGDIAMAETGMYQEARILADNPEFYYSGDWMVVPFPVFENAVDDVSACYYGHYYMVNDSADERTKKAAWEFISYMLSHGEEYLREVAIIQPTKALMESDTYRNMPYSEVFREDFSRGHFVYYGAISAGMQNLLRSAVESVMLQGETPHNAYIRLKRAAQELLDESTE